MDAEQIAAEIRSLPALFSNCDDDATPRQIGLIMFLTRDAFIDCRYDENPIVEYLWDDERPTELSMGNASRFIDYFGKKPKDGEWSVMRVGEMTILHRAWMETKGQLLLFEL